MLKKVGGTYKISIISLPRLVRAGKAGLCWQSPCKINLFLPPVDRAAGVALAFL